MRVFWKIVLCGIMCVAVSVPALADEAKEAGVAVITVPFASTLVDDGTRDDEVLYGMTAEVKPEQDGDELRELKMSYGYTWVESKNFRVVTRERAERWRSSVTHRVIRPSPIYFPRRIRRLTRRSSPCPAERTSSQASLTKMTAAGSAWNCSAA